MSANETVPTEVAPRSPWGAEVPSERVTLALGDRLYRWREYATTPEPTRAWAHHGVVAGPGGHGFVAASPDGRAFFHLSDEVGRAFEAMPVTECHGMSVDAYDSDYSIWIADNGHKYGHRMLGNDLETDRPGQVVRAGLNGELLQTLDSDQLSEPARCWRPTSVTSESKEQGGRVWVADGYGQSFVHCFSREGDLLWSSDGADSGMPFNSPHAIILDTRRPAPQLLVADRGNKRIVALTPDGAFIRSLGSGILTSPSGFAIDGELLWVTELLGAIIAFDLDDAPAAQLGTALESNEPGWPNTVAGDIVERPRTKAGVFRSPHGIAVDADERSRCPNGSSGGGLSPSRRLAGTRKGIETSYRRSSIVHSDHVASAEGTDESTFIGRGCEHRALGAAIASLRRAPHVLVMPSASPPREPGQSGIGS